MKTIHHEAPEYATCEIDGIGLALAVLDIISIADLSGVAPSSLPNLAHAANEALREHLSAIADGYGKEAPETGSAALCEGEAA
ncbi:hypothetical protein [Aliiroseovarius crassostreae]|uniref:hypothetical protein n=1 Tax=Aliiroseovarius crassostreae TaxID=154981 RepID=UPI00220631F4|nr:hypothetical protein [Aliiroseovarius crassostreae]UWQ07922.1 hypothetical protein K3X25_14500 [Aliiroseovarius crassostreae]